MNRIVILQPRWHNKTVLIADYKIGNTNEIRITAKKKDGSPYYPNAAQVSGQILKTYPTEQQPHGLMRVVPLQDLLSWSVPNAN